MSDALDTILEAVSAMNPITKSWLIHGAIVTEALMLLDVDDLTADQRERLASGCDEWGAMLTEAGLLWWDARNRLLDEAEAA